MKYTHLKTRKKISQEKRDVLLVGIAHSEAYFELNRYFTNEMSLNAGYARLILIVYLFEYNDVYITAKWVSSYTGIPMKVTGRMLMNLVTRKLLYSEKVENRVNYYKLTDAGKEVLDIYFNSFSRTEQFLTDIMDKIGEEQHEKMVAKRQKAQFAIAKKRRIERVKNLKIPKN